MLCMPWTPFLLKGCGVPQRTQGLMLFYPTRGDHWLVVPSWLLPGCTCMAALGGMGCS